jgi:hypothetical protein
MPRYQHRQELGATQLLSQRTSSVDAALDLAIELWLLDSEMFQDELLTMVDQLVLRFPTSSSPTTVKLFVPQDHLDQQFGISLGIQCKSAIAHGIPPENLGGNVGFGPMSP